MGPWPMSVLPCQVPTSDFMRSNSAEPGLGCGISPAVRSRDPASRKVTETEVHLIFIMFSLFCVNCFTFHLHNEREREGGTLISTFLGRALQGAIMRVVDLRFRPYQAAKHES